MMFKGAKKYSGKQLDHLFHENGITNNAFTSNDYTGFYENIPSSKLELVMDIEVDRMKNLALQAEDLLSEKEVVAEERRWRIDNNPMGFLRESLMATVFKSHPYGWPVIGFMKDINAYDIEKLRYFYNTYYVPNNAVLVIVGDFDTKKTKKMVEKYYGTLTFKEVPHKNIKPEPVQTVQRNTVIRKDVQNTSFAIAFQSPKIGEADMYALDLAASILGDGSSSRIYKRLVYERQLATSAYAYNYSLQDGGIFSVGVNVIPGQTKDQALEISYNEIWKLRNKKVTDQELEKAKTQVIKNIVDGLRTIDGKARSLATNEIVTGSYQAIFTDLEKYQQVTADDILRVANKYLQQTQRSIISLEPKK
jgi:zinc protease